VQNGQFALLNAQRNDFDERPTGDLPNKATIEPWLPAWLPTAVDSLCLGERTCRSERVRREELEPPTRGLRGGSSPRPNTPAYRRSSVKIPRMASRAAGATRDEHDVDVEPLAE